MTRNPTQLTLVVCVLCFAASWQLALLSQTTNDEAPVNDVRLVWQPSTSQALKDQGESTRLSDILRGGVMIPKGYATNCGE